MVQNLMKDHNATVPQEPYSVSFPREKSGVSMLQSIHFSPLKTNYASDVCMLVQFITNDT